MSTLRELNISLGLSTKEFDRKLKHVSHKLMQEGKKWGMLGKNLTMGLTLPLTGAGLAALKFATDFEDSFLRIENLVGITGNLLTDFEAGISGMTGPLAKSKTELSDALFVVTSAGERTKDALITVAQASKASQIGLGNTAEIARAATAAVQAYGKENLTSAQAIDKFTAIVKEGNLKAEELAPVLGRVLGMSQELGISFDEVGANIATFTRLGVDSAEAVTALRGTMSAILKPSKQARDEMAKLGITAQDLRDTVAKNGLAATLQDLVEKYDGNIEGLARLFPRVRALAGVLGTAGAQGEVYLEIVDSISKSNGIVNAGFEKVSKSGAFKMRQALVELQDAGQEIGETLLPAVTELLKRVIPVISKFSEFSEGTKKAIVATGLFAAALGPAFMILSTYKAALQATVEVTKAGVGYFRKFAGAIMDSAIAFGKANWKMQATTIGLVIAAVAAAVLIWRQWNREQLDTVGIMEEAGLQTKRLQIEFNKEVEILKTANISQNARKELIKKINKKYSEYLPNLIKEKDNLDKITAAQKSANEAFRNKIVLVGFQKIAEEATTRLAKAQLKELSLVEKLVAAQEKYNRKADEAVGIVYKNDTAQQQAVNALKQLKNAKSALEKNNAEQKKMTGELEKIEKAAKKAGVALGDMFGGDGGDGKTSAKAAAEATGKSGGGKGKSVISGLNDQKDILSELAATYANITSRSKLWGTEMDANAERSEALKKAMNDLLEKGIAPGDERIAALMERYKNLNLELLPVNDNLVNLTPVLEVATNAFDEQENKLTKLGDAWKGFGETIAETAELVGLDLQDLAMQGETSFARLGEAALQGAADVVRAALMEFVADTVRKTSLAGGPFGPALALAAGAVAGVGFNALIGGLKIPALAEGAFITKPTVAMIGEKGPEIVTPPQKLPGLAAMMGMTNKSSTTKLTGEFRLRGNDMYLLVREAALNDARRNGGSILIKG